MGTSGGGTVHLTALDVPVAVRVSGDGAGPLKAAIEQAWQRCLAEPAEGSLRIEAWLASTPDAVAEARAGGAIAATTIEELMHELTPAITIAAITRQRESLLMLHACAVADPQTGATVALVGPSGMGKTTAARTLGRSFGYVTDETVALRDDNSVVAYPKPLSLCPEGDGLYKRQVSPADLRRPPKRLHLAAMLLLDRDEPAPGRRQRGCPARACPDLEEIPTVRALAALVPQVSFLASRPKPLHRLADAVAGAGGLRLVRYRDADQLVPVVRALLEAAR